MPNTRLDELSDLEWYDVMRVIKPRLTWEEFSDAWEEFQARKALKALH